MLDARFEGILDDASHAALSAMSAGFPQVQGGGSLILAWQIKGKNVLVIGGGEVGILAQCCHHFMTIHLNSFAGRRR